MLFNTRKIHMDTNRQEFLDCIKFISSKYFFGLREFDLGKAFHHELFELCFQHIPFCTRTFLGQFVSTRQSYDFDNHGLKVLLYYSDVYENRSDVKLMLDNVTSTITDYTVLRGNNNRRIAIGNIIRLLLVPLWIYQLRKCPCNRAVKIYIVHCLAKALNIKAWLKKYSAILDCYCVILSLNDQNIDENMFVQYFRNIGKKSITMQHGIYLSSKSDNSMDSYNDCLENLTADYLFSWGQFTRLQAENNGIRAEQIICGGCPKYFHRTKHIISKHSNIIGVALESPRKKEDVERNCKLIQFASRLADKFEFTVVYRRHPGDTTNYPVQSTCKVAIDYKTSFEDFALECAFIITSGKTTVYAESCLLGVLAFRYLCIEEQDDYFFANKYAFKTFAELERLVFDNFGHPENYLHDIEQYADYIFGPLDNGTAFLDALKFVENGQ